MLNDDKLPRAALVLGWAGLIPQLVACWLTLLPADRFIGLAAGYFYAALIFSFLGGTWWGIGAANRAAPKWVFAAAIIPSLIAFATGVPWMTGAPWPGPSLFILGLGLLGSPLVDWRLRGLGLMGTDAFRLRLLLSAGLGGLTLVLATR
jgi:Protein of unknown function (DUF3429)